MTARSRKFYYTAKGTLVSAASYLRLKYGFEPDQQLVEMTAEVRKAKRLLRTGA